MSDEYKEPDGIEQNKYHWGWFCIWAKENGVSLEHPDDYGPWWDCWKTSQERASLSKF